MRMSDWISDVCSSDLSRFSERCSRSRKCSVSACCPESGILPTLGAEVCGGCVLSDPRSGYARNSSTGSICQLPLSLLVAEIRPSLIAFRMADLERPTRSAASFGRSEEHTSELQSLMRISYAVFCLKKKKTKTTYS